MRASVSNRFVANSTAMPAEIVVCRVRGGFTWEGSSEQFCKFDTDRGWFTRKTNEIPREVQRAVDTGATVKAIVDTKPDHSGQLRFIKFLV
jgi:hypothetical protein